MKGAINHEKAFISLFNQTARYHQRHQVFEDFVSCSVIRAGCARRFVPRHVFRDIPKKIALFKIFIPSYLRALSR